MLLFLQDIMFDQKIALEGEDGGLTLPYSKTIFVMEDVDAASTVVQRRWGCSVCEVCHREVHILLRVK
jgi:hypothetical protein